MDDDSQAGTESAGQRWSWDEIRRLDGWDVGRAHHDAHGAGFWIHKFDPNTRDRLPGPR